LFNPIVEAHETIQKELAMWNFICVSLFVFVIGIAADAQWHCGHLGVIPCLGIGAFIALCSLTSDLK